MIRRGLRSIQSKVARAMCTWSHYHFRQYLLHKAREYPHCKVVLCSEEYMSKTCENCGIVNDKLGGSKTFKCGNCLFVLDRDINSARNVLLCFFTVND
jgi:transposase